MTRLILHVRSFHPLSNFGPSGLGYHGDDRDFSTDVGAKTTSRIYMQKTFDLARAVAQPGIVQSAPSSHFLGMKQDYSQANTKPTMPMDSAQIDAYRPDGDQGFQTMVAYTGQNFAMPFVQEAKGVYDAIVPGLDVTCSLHAEIDRDDKKMSFSFRMVGDGFPNTEAFLLDAGNKPLMLATHRRIGSALHQLRGNRRIAMASSSAVVDFDAGMFGAAIDVNWCLDYATVTGSQIDVMEETGKNPTTVSEWNIMHTGREAKGGFLRRSQDIIPTYAPGRPGSSMP